MLVYNEIYKVNGRSTCKKYSTSWVRLKKKKKYRKAHKFKTRLGAKYS